MCRVTLQYHIDVLYLVNRVEKYYRSIDHRNGCDKVKDKAWDVHQGGLAGTGWSVSVSVEEERPTSTFGSRPEALVGSTCAFSWEHMGLHPGTVTLHMHM